MKGSSSGDSDNRPNGDDKGLGSPAIYNIISIFRLFQPNHEICNAVLRIVPSLKSDV
jgi:hypothetical protein